MVAFRNFSTLTAFLWEKPLHICLDWHFFLISKHYGVFSVVELAFWRLRKALIVTDKPSRKFSTLTLTYMHSITELSQKKKFFPPKKLIQIHLRRRKAIKIDRKRTESLNIIIFVGAKKLYLLLFSQWVFRIKNW